MQALAKRRRKDEGTPRAARFGRWSHFWLLGAADDPLGLVCVAFCQREARRNVPARVAHIRLSRRFRRACLHGPGNLRQPRKAERSQREQQRGPHFLSAGRRRARLPDLPVRDEVAIPGATDFQEVHSCNAAAGLVQGHRLSLSTRISGPAGKDPDRRRPERGGPQSAKAGRTDDRQTACLPGRGRSLGDDSRAAGHGGRAAAGHRGRAASRRQGLLDGPLRAAAFHGAGRDARVPDRCQIVRRQYQVQARIRP